MMNQNNISLERVLNGLECCATNRLRREDCEAMKCTYLDLEGHGCIHQLIRDALALVKAQKLIEPEPKEVIYDDEHRSVYCPSCDNRLAGLTYSGAIALETEETPNYCWMCGQVVKW